MPSSAVDPAEIAATSSGDASVEAVLERLRDVGARDLPLVDLMELAGHIVASVRQDACAVDDTILGEVRAIAESIAQTKADIARLRPKEVSSHHIPEAGRELAAVVEATEDATHSIMEAAESLLAGSGGDLDSYKTHVESEAMKIFEACTFQDITGQRVTKVVDTLRDIEERVEHMAVTLGIPATGDGADGGEPISDRQRARDERNERLILNGPALSGEGMAQDDVDSILQGVAADNTSTQDSIDALFD